MFAISKTACLAAASVLLVAVSAAAMISGEREAGPGSTASSVASSVAPPTPYADEGLRRPPRRPRIALEPELAGFAIP
jgi:hypothetical protein